MAKDYELAVKVTTKLIYELKYFYWESLTGLVKMCLDSGCSLNQDTINGIKDAIIDDMYCGMEPEFEEYGMWQWWESLSYEWFLIKEQKHFDGKLVSYVECTKKPKDFIEGQNG